LEDVLEFNLPMGAHSRGLRVINTVKLLLGEGADQETLKKAAVLGWCVEMLHVAHRLKTDIIQEEEQQKRKMKIEEDGERRTPWHVARGLGPIAFNDAILLNGAMYFLLQEYFSDHPNYARLLNLTHEAQLHKSFGHTLKSKTKSLNGEERRHLNLRRYEAIVKYESGFFSFYFPVAAALALCGATEFDTEALKTILCKIGLLNQSKFNRLICNRPVIIN
jgi:farnesyl diphosphate synthase